MNQKVQREMPKAPLNALKKKEERDLQTKAKSSSKKDARLNRIRQQNLSHSSSNVVEPAAPPTAKPSSNNAGDSQFFEAKREDIKEAISQSLSHLEGGGVYQEEAEAGHANADADQYAGEGPHFQQNLHGDSDDALSIEFSD